MSQSPPPKQRNSKKLPHFVALRLNDIHDLFALPRHNAFQDNYLPLSGIDQIALQLKMAHLRQGIHVTFILPASTDPIPDLKTDIQAAVKRYCDTRINNLMFELKAQQLRVVRSLQVGVIILGVSLALAAAISRTESIVDWLRMLLSNSISIFGSVALWSPTDAFLFGLRPLYNDMYIYHSIREMSFEIQYENPDSPLQIANQIPNVRGIR